MEWNVIILFKQNSEHLISERIWAVLVHPLINTLITQSCACLSVIHPWHKLLSQCPLLTVFLCSFLRRHQPSGKLRAGRINWNPPVPGTGTLWKISGLNTGALRRLPVPGAGTAWKIPVPGIGTLWKTPVPGTQCGKHKYLVLGHCGISQCALFLALSSFLPSSHY